MESIITSLADIDKSTILSLHGLFTNNQLDDNITYNLIADTQMDHEVDPTLFIKPHIIENLIKQVSLIDGLKFTDDEVTYIINMLDINEKSSFEIYLREYTLKSNNVIFEKILNDDGKIIDYNISIQGKLDETLLWKSLLLSIYNELYSNFYSQYSLMNIKQTIEINKAIQKEVLNSVGADFNFKFYDCGTMYRASKKIQEMHLKDIIDLKEYYVNFLGTSNIHLAMKLNIDCYESIFDININASNYIDIANEVQSICDINEPKTISALRLRLNDVLKLNYEIENIIDPTYAVGIGITNNFSIPDISIKYDI